MAIPRKPQKGLFFYPCSVCGISLPQGWLASPTDPPEALAAPNVDALPKVWVTITTVMTNRTPSQLLSPTNCAVSQPQNCKQSKAKSRANELLHVFVCSGVQEINLCLAGVHNRSYLVLELVSPET